MWAEEQSLTELCLTSHTANELVSGQSGSSGIPVGFSGLVVTGSI